MSKKSAKDFIERVEKDGAFRAELLKAKSDKERQKMVASNKFIFTQQEYQEAYKEKYHTAVNEEELRRVVGGTTKGAKPLPKDLSKMSAEVAKVHCLGVLAMSQD